MTNSIFRGVAGSLAGAVAALAGNLTYAATLNQNLQVAREAPQGLVGDFHAGGTEAERFRPVRIAEARKPLPGLKAAGAPATAAEIVAKMLAPGASNPDVPLPHPDLSERFSDRTQAEGPLKGPTPYGRGEAGGGVLGVRMPIPVERGAATGTTTSSPVVSGPESAPEAPPRP